MKCDDPTGTMGWKPEWGMLSSVDSNINVCLYTQSHGSQLVLRMLSLRQSFNLSEIKFHVQIDVHNTTSINHSFAKLKPLTSDLDNNTGGIYP